MSNTGGGHRASANALKAGFEAHGPGVFHIEIIDLLADFTFWPLSEAPELYAAVATHLPWLWGAAYSTERTPTFVRGLMQAAAHLARRRVAGALEQHRPHLVVSVHPLAQEIVLHALRDLNEHESARPIPFATVVTDLATAHPLWLHPQVSGCFVPSEEIERQALAAGIPATRIHRLGLPIRPAFAAPPLPREQVRARLQLHPTLPAVLLMGGGDGVGPVEEIAAALDAALAGHGGESPAGQIVVICGRNDGLRQQLDARPWQCPHRVLGFVEEMPAWMWVCDAIVTKAGPGTIAEACICGLPLLLSGFIPGQESANVDFVRRHGAGIYEPDPLEIATIVRRWFGPDAATRTRLAANAAALGKPLATAQIVERLAALAAAAEISR